ncbi:hypothetical protein L1987_04461 [Smallanthus sonchifolius]|uniref:Uncharacterized protein n=1 Tax=Smallanthus sonchifolius TaxID=185202 RepID=A0ACB9JSM5_9ASTR|nr:hypothetical protein L1987_04461 [Smallanthus sonchifolius]
MFMQKVNFMQNFVPSRPPITQLGFSEFKVGHAKNKDCPNSVIPKKIKVSRTDSLYAELAAKEARLKEIAININKKDKNATLLNSILGMKSCNLRKFSAKVNDHGIVTIDENMVQAEEADGYARVLVELKVDTVLTDVVKVWYQQVNGSKEKFVNIEVEYLNVPAKCDHCKAFGHDFNACKVRPKTTEELADVQKMKGSGTGNNHRNNNSQGGRRRNNTKPRANSNGRTGDTGIVNLYERNIVNNQNVSVGKDESAARRENENLGGNLSNKTNPQIPGLRDQRTKGERVEASGKGFNAPTPKYRVVENTNRFSLLDTEGNELENVIEGMGDTTTQRNRPCNSNEGWIKKQERILNTNYSKDITQEQRFEAKRYVIDQLVPLESVLSGWPSSQLQYFRQLCSIHNFGLGYVATNREGDEDRTDVNMGMDVESIEEVESETEGAAVIMKDDGPIAATIVNQSNIAQDTGSPSQRDMDMIQAGNDSIIINES